MGLFSNFQSLLRENLNALKTKVTLSGLCTIWTKIIVLILQVKTLKLLMNYICHFVA